MDVDADVDRVHGGLGMGAVASAALHPDDQVVTGGGDHAGAVAARPAGIMGTMWAPMAAPHGDFQVPASTWSWPLTGPPRRLEHELDSAVELCCPVPEQLGRPQQHGGVHVVAAGVGTAALRGEGEPALLTHGQSVHIGPEQEHLPVGFPVKVAVTPPPSRRADSPSRSAVP